MLCSHLYWSLLPACAMLRLEMAGRDTAGRYSSIAITSACVDEDRNPAGPYWQGLCKSRRDWAAHLETASRAGPVTEEATGASSCSVVEPVSGGVTADGAQLPEDVGVVENHAMVSFPALDSKLNARY
ncbi:hypothetical protein F2Q69_00005320 [Brassica cretica]|uniref:START domain-containing protein n=1 Tax=Brassica cretica TaxID=69181 RepID=A0A8S9PJR7_BRACR|nr:hypothetical protein F2Q69_00005320 [Brassica cretica]